MDDDAGAPGLAQAARELRAAEVAAADLSRAVGTGLRRAMETATARSGSLGDAMRGLGADLARATLRASLAPLSSAVAKGLGGAAASAVGALSGGLGAAVRGFASGGVLGSGLLATREGPARVGEDGPEAILPLARGADGRLGVRGAGGARVVVNITTPDVEGFRRSEAQVSAALARAVARGQRRL